MTVTSQKLTDSTAAASFDPYKVRADFPILQTTVSPGGPKLIYLDNGATTQKPRQVIDAISRYYESQNANIHRGVYRLSQVATDLYESARRKVQAFINAADEKECLFVRGTTEGVNLVAGCWGRTKLKAGDEVLVSTMEHHSNIVPWQIACEMTGATLRVIPMNDAGELAMDDYAKMLSERTKFVAVTHLSNAMGTVNDVKTIARLAHKVGAKVLVDGAQWVAHAPTDVRDIDADFYVFSGHKLFGPTGIGVLYGKRELLEAMPPYMGGGDMIESVTFEKSTYAQLPNKFEAGTPDIAGAVGLGAAIDYVTSIGVANYVQHEQDLLHYATEQLSAIPGLRIIGTAKNKGSVVSFVMDGIASLDIGTRLDGEGVAVRTGHHCCMPLMNRLGIPSTTRASFAMYNTREDVDALVAAVQKVRQESNAKVSRAAAANESASGNGHSPAALADAKYPDPAAGSPTEAADELAETFDFLGDWTERYHFVIEMGAKLLPMPAVMKTEATRVHGCQSTVHLFARAHPKSPDRLDFLADSDADIVRGLIAILQKVFAGQRAKDVLAFDVESFFRRLGLDQHLTTGRRNGLAGMVERIRQFAARLA
ncbi:SufS family cysteine desulfurase [Humisphaera borealis]|uniref:cysteine desulfurase n=1 Tax=Humisphaera borealis TaxID=2807512 RepID=A0A7M2WRL6_9BACT|nr:SufS family cysteine desulfurase [Humisphaera borealis]